MDAYTCLRYHARRATLTGMKAQEKRLASTSTTDRPSAKLELRGGVPVLGERCVSTASGVRADYKELSWTIRKAEQYIQQRQKQEPKIDLVSGVKRDFRDTILVGDENYPGFATDSDLKKLITNPYQAPSELAVDLISERTGLTPATVLTYTKERSSAKKKPISRTRKRAVPNPIT